MVAVFGAFHGGVEGDTNRSDSSQALGWPLKVANGSRKWEVRPHTTTFLWVVMGLL